MRGIQLLCIRVPSYAELQLSGPGAYLLILTSQCPYDRPSVSLSIVTLSWSCHRSARLVIYKVTIGGNTKAEKMDHQQKFLP